MAKLFAGIGNDGTVYFVDEVPRGAVCGCHCPECQSPLIAKQGEARAWHFAHEGGQERPECEAGAANLLRRVAAQFLQAQREIEFPPFQRRIEVRRGGRVWGETVELRSRTSSVWHWADSPARRSPVATSLLIDGCQVELHVEVAQPAATTDFADVAVVSFILALPRLEELQSRAAAELYIKSTGSMHWRQRPDPDGVFSKVADKLERQADSAEAHDLAGRMAADAEREQQRRNQPTGTVASIDSRLDSDTLYEERARTARVSARAAAAASIEQCTPRRAAHSSLIHYRLRNGTAWILYTLDDGDAGFVQWPPGQPALPRPPIELAAFDEQLGVYRTQHHKAIPFLASRTMLIRTESDAGELAQWVAANP